MTQDSGAPSDGRIGHKMLGKDKHARLLHRIYMEQHIFFSLIIEGTTEKVLQFIMPLRSIYN